MPRFNETGPSGYGPGTGWGMGPCGGGMARGRGRRFGNYGPRLTKEQEIGMLSGEAEALERELKVVKNRLTILEEEE